jgi:hypothetical protein
LGREIRDYERPPRDGGATAVAMPPRHFNPLLIIGIALWGMAAFYAALVVASQLDETFFPGNEFSIGIEIPGVEAPQDSRRWKGASISW